LEGETGTCRSTASALVASAGPHYGEEPPLVGRNGSGTIFFAGCNLRCLFCQNHHISHGRAGTTVSAADLAEIMLALQRRGCHNINLVTPTHVLPAIIEALVLAAQAGLRVPLVYNCGGYESTAALRLLDGIVDIYMPDVKYADDEKAEQFSGAPHYWSVVQSALREMHRQVGTLFIGPDGVARRGVLIRHLVLPGDLARASEIFRFVAGALSPDAYVNIMDQYRPAYLAALHPALDRSLTAREYEKTLGLALAAGLHRGFGIPEQRFPNFMNSV
jgi:putative pyruvate formate lyase activating enzyme